MCRELGFENGYALPRAAYGPNYFRYFAGPYNCRGNETTITQCSAKSTTCYRRSSADYVSIGCYNGTVANGKLCVNGCEFNDTIARKKGRKDMVYLTTHSTHFIYGYIASDIW